MPTVFQPFDHRLLSVFYVQSIQEVTIYRRTVVDVGIT